MYLPSRLRHLATITGTKARTISTHIYVVQCNEFIKVGIASNVSLRLSELQVGNPYPIQLIGHWAALDAIKEEEMIHSHLGPYRVRGEWFKLPKSLMDNICMKMPGYELAQWIMPHEQFVALRPQLWRNNASAYLSERCK